MTYASEQEFTDSFGEELTIELTNLEDATATSINSDVFDRVATDSDSLINSYLAGRYAMPLSTVPGVIRTIALDIYRYKLGHNAQEEDVRQRYEDALKQLRDISQGIMNLGLDDGSEETLPGSPAFYTPVRTFSNESLIEFTPRPGLEWRGRRWY